MADAAASLSRPPALPDFAARSGDWRQQHNTTKCWVFLQRAVQDSPDQADQVQEVGSRPRVIPEFGCSEGPWQRLHCPRAQKQLDCMTDAEAGTSPRRCTLDIRLQESPVRLQSQRQELHDNKTFALTHDEYMIAPASMQVTIPSPSRSRASSRSKSPLSLDLSDLPPLVEPSPPSNTLIITVSACTSNLQTSANSPRTSSHPRSSSPPPSPKSGKPSTHTPKCTPGLPSSHSSASSYPSSPNTTPSQSGRRSTARL